MSLASNTIRSSEMSTTPVKIKYYAGYTSSLDVNSGLVIFDDTSITARPGRNGDPSLRSFIGAESRLYRMVKQLYFQNYFTGSLLNSASYWDWNMQSTAYSGSFEYEYRYLPSGSNDKIGVIYVPPQYASEQITRFSFNLKPVAGNDFDIWDDGNGNLIDKENNDLHVGTIIYSNGVIIITDPGYASLVGTQTTDIDPYYFPVGPGLTGYVATTVTDIYVERTP